MPKIISHNSANIELDDTFVERARAVSATGEIDGTLLATLLEVGLRSVEQSVADAQPVELEPMLFAEMDHLFERLDQFEEKAQAGRPQERPVTLMVTDASLLFMAFLDRLIRARIGARLPSDDASIDLDRPADIEGAVRYLTSQLAGHLGGELELMVQARHPLLKASTEASPRRGTLH